MYSCFLDASKANYDRVNHWTLFKKLLKRGISVVIVRILLFWYSKQEICIKWGNETSSCSTICNGVRQGGILSVVLFSIYMDDLSVLLSQSGIGCHIDDLCINHVFYADDLCLMAPCAIVLQELINLCYDQARQTRPNSGGVAEGHPRFDKGGVAIIFYFLSVKNRTF